MIADPKGIVRRFAARLVSPWTLGSVAAGSGGVTAGVLIEGPSVGHALVGGGVAISVLLLFRVGRRLMRLPAQRRAVREFGSLVRRLAGSREEDSDRRRDAVVEFEEVLRGSDRDVLLDRPWYAVLGVPGVGKTTLIRNCGLTVRHQRRTESAATTSPSEGGPTAAGESTWSLDWWMTNAAAFVDVAGRLVNPSKDERDAEREWGELVHGIRAARPRRPLNGIVVVVSALSLIEDGEADLAFKARSIADRLQEIRDCFGMRLPVYLVVSKVDRVEGFSALFRTMDERDRDQPLGWSFQGEPEDPLGWDEVSTGLRGLLQALMQRRTELLASGALEDTESAFLFARQLRQMQERIHVYVDQMLSGPCGVRGHLLRGVYLTSAIQRGGELSIDHAERKGAQERDTSGPFWGAESYFVRQLIERKVLRESKLGRAVVEGQGLVYRELADRAARAAAVLVPIVAVPFAWSGLADLGSAGRRADEVERVAEALEADATAPAPLADLAGIVADPLEIPVVFYPAARIGGSERSVLDIEEWDALRVIAVEQHLAAFLGDFAARVRNLGVRPAEARAAEQARVHAAWQAIAELHEWLRSGPDEPLLDTWLRTIADAMEQPGDGIAPDGRWDAVDEITDALATLEGRRPRSRAMPDLAPTDAIADALATLERRRPRSRAMPDLASTEAIAEPLRDAVAAWPRAFLGSADAATFDEAVADRLAELDAALVELEEAEDVGTLADGLERARAQAHVAWELRARSEELRASPSSDEITLSPSLRLLQDGLKPERGITATDRGGPESLPSADEIALVERGLQTMVSAVLPAAPVDAGGGGRAIDAAMVAAVRASSGRGESSDATRLGRAGDAAERVLHEALTRTAERLLRQGPSADRERLAEVARLARAAAALGPARADAAEAVSGDEDPITALLRTEHAWWSGEDDGSPRGRIVSAYAAAGRAANGEGAETAMAAARDELAAVVGRVQDGLAALGEEESDPADLVALRRDLADLVADAGEDAVEAVDAAEEARWRQLLLPPAAASDPRLVPAEPGATLRTIARAAWHRGVIDAHDAHRDEAEELIADFAESGAVDEGSRPRLVEAGTWLVAMHEWSQAAPAEDADAAASSARPQAASPESYRQAQIAQVLDRELRIAAEPGRLRPEAGRQVVLPIQARDDEGPLEIAEVPFWLRGGRNADALPTNPPAVRVMQRFSIVSQASTFVLESSSGDDTVSMLEILADPHTRAMDRDTDGFARFELVVVASPISPQHAGAAADGRDRERRTLVIRVEGLAADEVEWLFEILQAHSEHHP